MVEMAPPTVETYVGRALGERELFRFLTGPKECEITGLAESSDGRTLFVNIQHPGAETPRPFRPPRPFGSHGFDGGNARRAPRRSRLRVMTAALSA